MWSCLSFFVYIRLKCCTQHASKFGKLSSGHRTGKDQSSCQAQRKAMPENVQSTTQLHSSHMLVKVMLKILQARLHQYVNHKLPDVQAGFRKGRGMRDLIANISWIIKKARQFQNKIIPSGPITSWQIDGGKWKQWQMFFFFSWAPKSLQMVTAAMKLKDACFLEEKLWAT